MNRFLFCFFLLVFMSVSLVAQKGENDFVSLFDGKTLNGWTSSEENPKSFFVKEGNLIVKGGRAHLFYTGKVGDAAFKNFELKMKVKTTAGSNSGVYFHTQYQKSGWPKIGFEAQVNSTHTDPKKTGSLYGIFNIWVPEELADPFQVKVNSNGEIFLLQDKAPSTDGEWFDYHITVKDKLITVRVDGKITVIWNQPKDWSKDRRIGQGTIGLQAHDPKCEVHYKDIQIKVLD